MGVGVVDFAGVLGFFVADVVAGLEPATAFFFEGFAGEEGWLHATFIEATYLGKIADQ